MSPALAAGGSRGVDDGVAPVPYPPRPSRISKRNLLAVACRRLGFVLPTPPHQKDGPLLSGNIARTTATKMPVKTADATGPGHDPMTAIIERPRLEKGGEVETACACGQDQQMGLREHTCQAGLLRCLKTSSDQNPQENDVSFMIRKPIAFAKPKLLYFPLAVGRITDEQWIKYNIVKDIIMGNFDNDSQLCGQPLGWDVVMTGRDVDDVRPTILIGAPPWLWKRVQHIIDRPHVSAQYEPTFRVLVGSIKLLGREADVVDILFIPGASLSGCPVLRNRDKVQISTVSCILSINGRLYAMTAGHPFNGHNQLLGFNNPNPDDKTGNEPDDEVSDETPGIPIVEAPGSVFQAYQHRSCSVSRVSDSRVGDKSDLDWALVELDPKLNWGTDGPSERGAGVFHYNPGFSQQLRRVIIMLPFVGQRTGYIRFRPTTIFNWDNSGAPMELWTVTLSDDNGVREGLSGALVADAETSQAYGHVVAVSSLGDLHVVPLERTLRQISNVVGSEVEVWYKPLTDSASNARAGVVHGANTFSTRTSRPTRNPAVKRFFRNMSRYLPKLSNPLSKLRHILRKSSVSASRTWIGRSRKSVGKLAFQIEQENSAPIKYWDVVGPAQEAWKQLGGEIAHELDRRQPGLASSQVNSFRMYMVGTDEQTAEPTLVFFSSNKTAESADKDTIQKSHIMDKYPGLRLAKADDAVHAKFSGLSVLATHETEFPWAADSSVLATSERQAVLAPSGDEPLGRRLFIPREGGNTGRAATGGPIIRIDGKIFQLTVGHAFRETISGTQLTSDTMDNSQVDPSTGGTPPGDNTPRGELLKLDVQKPPAQIGKLSILPKDGPGIALDYALIELEGDYRKGENSLPVGARVSRRRNMLSDFAEIPSAPTDVVTMTASTGFISGWISGTPTFIRLPGANAFEALYPVALDGTLSQGDCGSAIVHRRNGKVFGHIVCGIPGTGSAYVMPVTRIIRDLMSRLKRPVLLNNYQERAKLLLSQEAPSGADAEFGSNKFVETINPGVGIKSKQLREQAHALRDARLTVGQGSANNEAPESHPLAAIPPEIFAQIVGSLSALEIIRLRLVARSWNHFLTHHEGLVAVHHRWASTTPELVFSLYLVGRSAATGFNLWSITAAEYRAHQAESLSSFMAEWLTVEMFLKKSRRQRRDFESARILLQQRIYPLLVIILHFLERYRQTLLAHLARGIPFHEDNLEGLPSLRDQVEQDIMTQYPSEMLLEAHQFFPVLLWFLDRLLRPPSYLSTVEKALTGRLTIAPTPEKRQVAILCIGGLPLVLKLARIGSLERRLSAVPTWCAEISPDTPDSFHAGVFACSSGNASRGKNSVVQSTSLEAGPPMGQLLPSELSLLLKSLPESLREIWSDTAQRLLLERNVVSRIQDFKNSGEVMGMLISFDTTPIDGLLDFANAL